MSTARKLDPDDVPLARDVFQGKSPSASFVVLLQRGFWPIGIYPSGSKLPGSRERIASGKEPIGAGWGLERWTLEKANATFRKWKGAGIGICLGPGRAPGEGWLIDIEGDGPEAEESRAKLFGGEEVETLGWGSARGRHMVLIADQARLEAIMPGLKILESKGPNGTGVYKSDALPGLELRIGGFKPDGSVKQVQSVVPPTHGTDDQARVWIGPFEVALVPDAFYEALGQLASKSASNRPSGGSGDGPYRGRATTSSDRWTPEARAVAYLQKCEPAISGQAGHRKAFKAACKIGPGFDLHPDTAFRLLREVYNPTCDPRWSEKELRHKVDEAYKVETRRGWLLEEPRKGERNGRHSDPSDASDASDASKTPPPNPGTATGNAPREFANYHLVEGEADSEGQPKYKPEPNPLARIVGDLNNLAPGWPKRIGERLFYASTDLEPVFLDSASRLFAWIDKMTGVAWTKGARFITQERFYEHLRMNAERFDSIETMPHTPTMPNVYYMHAPPPKSSGKLDQLVNFFCPATPVDRELLKSLFVTPGWGGPGGKRPAFLITGPDEDDSGRQGRGVGKSTLLDSVSELHGGAIDVQPADDMAKVKTRALSPAGCRTRILKLDNVKTLRFSWAELEGLITSPYISGHAMYVGEGRRPNCLTVIITLNGASLSKDLSERVVVIKLDRPKRVSAAWEERVRGFVETHRAEILSEIADILAWPAPPPNTMTRWATWEAGVLCRMQKFEECQKVISERQGAIDDDNLGRDLLVDRIKENILERGYDPDKCHLRIPSSLMAAWVSEAIGKKMDPARATNHLKALAISELSSHKGTKGTRLWVWKTTDDPYVVAAELPPMPSGTKPKDRY